MAATTTARAPASLADGRYRIEASLGAGATGEVYVGFDRARRMPVAIKLLRARGVESIARFKREFRAAQRLAHRNLVSLFELGEDAGTWYITMELVEGDDFRAHVATPPPSSVTAPLDVMAAADDDAPRFDLARLRPALAQLAEAVAALHAAGVVHRDLKPANVKVTPAGRVVVLDFGLAVSAAPGARAALGTPAYMAPEQSAPGPVGGAADWYAVGAMLFEALTGELPFTGRGHDVVANKQRFSPPSPASIAPGVPPDLDRLCVDLLAIEPAARPTGAEVLARLAVGPSSASAPARRLIGRDAELARMEHALAELEACRAVAPLQIRGESGIGKTTVLDAFLDRAAARGACWVARGRCFERELTPYRGLDAVVEALAEQAPQHELAPELADVLARAFPALAGASGAGVAVERGVLDGGALADPPRVSVAVRRWLAALAARRPVIVAIDDLQWAGADTIELLAAIVTPRLPGILVVTASRTPVTELAGAAIDLAPLGCAATIELVRATAGTRSIDADAIARDSCGHPLIAAQLAHGGGTARSYDELVRAAAVRSGAVGATTLAAICLAAAPLSRDTAARIVAAPDEIQRAVVELAASRLVEVRGVGAAERLEPYHDRVRVAVLDGMTATERRALHRRLAAAYAATSGADPEPIALHWEAAGDPARAVWAASAAAAQAESALAFHRAARLYAWTAGLAAAAPEVAIDRPRLARKHAESLAHAGHGVEAADAYLAAATTTRGLASSELRRLAARELMKCGHTARALALVDDLLAELDLPNPTGAARLLRLVGHRVALTMRPLRLAGAPRASAPQRIRTELAWDLAAGLSLVDVVGSAYFNAVHQLECRRTQEPSRVVRALIGEVLYLASPGTPTRRLRRVLARVDAAGARTGLPIASDCAHGSAAYLAGRWAEAYTRLAAADRACTRLMPAAADATLGFSRILPIGRSMVIGALFFLGDLPRLAAMTPDLLRAADERRDVAAATYLHTGTQVHVWLAADDLAAATAHADAAIAPWTGVPTGFTHVMDLQARVAIALYAGDAAAALSLVTATWHALTRSSVWRSQYVRITLLDCRGRAALAAGDLADARRCVRRLRSERAPWAAALAAALTAAPAAAALLAAADMPLHAAAARGDLVRLAAAGVRDPARYARLLSPRRHESS
jgi:eukaryotic-like serine/threonine-protein kinase